MANRFLSNIKINDSYTLPSTDGTNGQIISTDGSGNLSFIDNTGDNARSIVFTVKNISGGNLTKGTVVHASPSATPPSGNVIEVIKADNDVSGSMPAIGVLNETLANEAEGDCVMMGSVSGIDTSAFSVGDELYVDSSPGAFTATKPTGTSNLIQKIAIVIKSHASNGLIEVFGAGRSNDVPNQIERNVNFTDNSKLTFGDSTTPDLQIYHDGSDSYIDETGTGDLIIKGGNDIIFKDAVGNLLANMNQSDRVELYFGGSKKFETYNTGVGVTGSAYLTSGNYIHFDNGVTNDYAIRKTGTTLEFKTGGTYNFLSGNAAFAGSVGIGTTSPTVQLDIEDSSNVIVDMNTTTANANTTIRFQESGSVKATVGYDGTNDGLILTTGGFTAGNGIFIDDSQNVGIGETSIDAKLHLTTASAGLINQKFESVGSAAWRLGVPASQTYFAFDNANDNLSTPKMVINNAGRVGIGTTNPDTELHIAHNSDSGADGWLTIEDTDTTAGSQRPHIAFQGNGTEIGRIRVLDTTGMQFATGSSTSIAMTIDQSQRVGIGTTSPDRQLQVHESTSGTSTAKFTNSTTGEDGDTGFFVGINGSEQPILYGYNNTDMVIGTNGSERMRIDSSGNVGIGTTSPAQKLDVAGIGQFAGAIRITETGTSQNILIGNQDSGGVNTPAMINGVNGELRFGRGNSWSGEGGTFTEVMRVSTNNNVGIGTTSPLVKLDVNGVLYSRGGTWNGGGSESDKTIVGFVITEGHFIFTKDGDNLRRLIGKTNDIIEIGEVGTSLIDGISFKSGTNPLYRWYSNNSEIMRLDSTGLGIGIASPNNFGFLEKVVHINAGTSSDTTLQQAGLVISGSSDADDADDFAYVSFLNNHSTLSNDRVAEIRVLKNGTDVDTGEFAFYTANGTSLNEAMRINELGYVGINDNDPVYRLHVESADDVQAMFKSTDNKGAIRIADNDTNAYVSAENGLASFGHNIGANTGNININSSGNVGIGTTSISDGDSSIGNPKLHVLGTESAGRNLVARLQGGSDSDNTYASLMLNHSNDRGLIFSGGRESGNKAIGFINLIQYDGNELVDGITLHQPNSASAGDTTGTNVGIGTTSPSAKLHLYVNSANDDTFHIFNGSVRTHLLGSESSNGVIYMRNSSNSNVIRINTSGDSYFNGGNVGIGTSSPAAKFEVTDGSSSITLQEYGNGAAIFLDGVNGDFIGGDYFHILADGNSYLGLGGYGGGSTPLNISNTGKVGIGTSSPSKKLHVVGDQLIYGNLYLESTSGSYRQIAMNTTDGADNQSLYLCGGGTASAVRGAQVVVKGNEVSSEGGSVQIQAGRVSTGDIIFKTGVTVGERMRIDEAGNVGIGTSSPLAKLHVENGSSGAGSAWTNADELIIENSGNVGLTLQSPNTAAATIAFQDPQSVQAGWIQYLHADNAMRFATNGNFERMRINSSGNVGIGETNPLTDLHVRDSSQNSNITDTVPSWWSGLFERSYTTTSAAAVGLVGGTQANGAGGYLYLGYSDDVDNNWIGISSQSMLFGVNTVERMRIDSSGNVGINVTSPSAGLQIALGSTTIPSAGSNTGSVCFGNTTSNNAYGIVMGADSSGVGYISSQRTDGNATTYNLTIQPNGGNVGMFGQTSPTSYSGYGVLHLGTSSTKGLVKFGNGNTWNGPEIYAIHTGGASNLRFNTNSTVNVLNLVGDKAGIGTTSPGAKLHVVSTTTPQFKVEYDGTRYVEIHHSAIFNVSGAGQNNDFYIGTRGNSGNNDIVFYTGGTTGTDVGTERMRIDSSGNVGIGTTSPSSRFQVKDTQDSSFDSGISIIRSNSSQTGYINMVGGAMNINAPSNIPIKIRDGGTANVTISGDGKVGIGTESPNGKLTVVEVQAANKGDFDFQQFVYNGGWSQNTDGLAAIQWSDGLGGSNTIGRIGVTYTGSQGEFQIKDLYYGGYAGSGKVFTVRGDGQAYFSGNVGIGTTAPSRKLHIVQGSTTAGGAYIYSNAIHTGTGTSSLVSIRQDHASATGTVLDVRGDGTGDKLIVWDTSDVALIVKDGGNVGIGTDSPTPKFHLKYTDGSYGADSTSGFINEATTGRGTMRIRSTTDHPAELFFDTNGAIRWDISCRNGTSPNLQFYPQAATPALNAVAAHTFELQQNGNVIVTGSGSSGKMGIGTTSPAAKLHVYESTGVGGTVGNHTPLTQVSTSGGTTNTVKVIEYALRLRTGTTWTHWGYHNAIEVDNSFGTPGTDSRTFWERDPYNQKHHFGSSGNFTLTVDGQNSRVGIKDTSPSYELDVTGTIRATSDIIAYSDKRIKENIKTIDNSLEKVNQLRGVEFNKIGEDKKSIGVIAQEIEKVIPEVVSTDENGMKSVAYGNITGILIEAIKELKQEIETLKTQINK